MSWNGSNNTVGRSAPDRRNQTNFQTSKPSNLQTIIRCLLAVLIIVALGGAAVWWFAGKKQVPSAPPIGDDHRVAHIAEVKPQIVTNKIEAVTNKVRTLTRAERLFIKTNGYVKAAGRMLTTDGRILTFPPPQGDEIRIVHTHGRIYHCDSKGNYVDVTPKPIFDNAFEQNLVGMAVEGGAFMPGMLLGHDPDEISAMLIKKVEINPSDPPDVVEKKQAVAALKKDIIAYIKDGGTFDQYVTEMRKQSVKERTMKAQGLKIINDMVKNGDTEGAAIFRDKFNKLVEGQGMRPLDLPERLEDAIGNAPTSDDN